MRFAQIKNRTRLAHLEQTPPWKVVREFASDSGSALLHLQNVSGGILAGDHLTALIELDARCQVQITTTGSTRIYKSRDDRPPALQELCFRLGPGAVLEYTPDSLIPFAGSRFAQRTTFELSVDSGLFAWEIVAPGRSGEAFALRELQIHTEIRASGGPIVSDFWHIEPELRRPDQVLQMGRFHYHATLYVCRIGISARHWLAWERAMAEAAGARCSPEEVWGVSALHSGGLAFRGLATEAVYLIDTLHVFWRAMKRELYSREPTLPRKMY